MNKIFILAGFILALFTQSVYSQTVSSKNIENEITKKDTLNRQDTVINLKYLKDKPIDLSKTYIINFDKDNTFYIFTIDKDARYNDILRLFNEKFEEIQSLYLGQIVIKLDFQDVNLDGYLDIVVNTGGTLNETHELYTWDAASQKFKKVIFNGFEMLSYFEVYDSYIRNWIRGGEDETIVQNLIWNGNTLSVKGEEDIKLGN